MLKKTYRYTLDFRYLAMAHVSFWRTYRAGALNREDSPWPGDIVVFTREPQHIESRVHRMLVCVVNKCYGVRIATPVFPRS